ncbi:PEGA domain-containing protein [Stigmatella sp. ncwal1]|uniref:PEGA domain-containing protein n=1 Tax=Stigmatella ashevillensis TaxID=2995309 RepID=A0ABT5DBS4_9BACT|nr:PEGA domain-containing protein [Stigmatella ashevillena]MDC0710961.1 PEGA domain-containing protein [Stigmatella ashevillena]
MSNARPPKTPSLPTQSSGDGEPSVMRRDQEMEHVQSRTTAASWNAPSGADHPGSPDASAGRGGTGGTLLSSTEAGRGKVAATLRMASAAFGLMASVLFVLPGVKGTFGVPPPEAAPPVQQNLKVITPTFDAPAPAEGMDGTVTEQTSSFDGASVLVIYSQPGGVAVEVDGSDQGGTPVSLTLDCLPGKPIRVELFKRGYERVKHTTFCRSDTMIKLFASMRKATKAPSGKK